MKTFEVIWRVSSLDAETPEEAAKKARKLVMDMNSLMTVYYVKDQETNETKVIDLEKLKDNQG